MHFISLGRHCATSYNIRKYIDSNIETQFFDWLRTDFKCVLEVLNVKNINEIFNIENIIVDKELYKDDNNLSITLKNFVKNNSTLLFHHDILLSEYIEQETNQKLIEFIDKYKRRYDRLIELIKTNKKLYFIYFITENFDYNDTNIFNILVLKINKNINYVLILMKEEKQGSCYIYNIYNNYIEINITNFVLDSYTDDWTLNKYDWKKMFELIQQTF